MKTNSRWRQRFRSTSSCHSTWAVCPQPPRSRLSTVGWRTYNTLHQTYASTQSRSILQRQKQSNLRQLCAEEDKESFTASDLIGNTLKSLRATGSVCIVVSDTTNVVEANQDAKDGTTALWHTVGLYRINMSTRSSCRSTRVLGPTRLGSRQCA